MVSFKLEHFWKKFFFFVAVVLKKDLILYYEAYTHVIFQKINIANDYFLGITSAFSVIHSEFPNKNN